MTEANEEWAQWAQWHADEQAGAGEVQALREELRATKARADKAEAHLKDAYNLIDMNQWQENVSGQSRMRRPLLQVMR